MSNLKIGILLAVATLWCSSTFGQQFNSDSWLSKPHGMATIIPTAGERNTMLMTTFSLFPKWEFTTAAYLYNDDNDPKTDDGYSASVYAKYMFYENKAQTGGMAIKAGTGLFPGNLDGEDRTKDAFKTYWMNMPCTVPLFNNKLSWDIMPGVSMTRNYGVDESTAWSFTYSTRLAWYAFGPTASFVGEVFGSKGQTANHPDYKIGWRWEPSQYVVWAFTYGGEFNGSNGAGFEVGVMLFTPPFLCSGPCK